MRRSRTAEGRLPLLAPMSEVAGKIATQAGAFMLEKPLGGRGILLGGVPGVAAATVLVIGGGVVGMNAAFIAIGMQADVFVFDRSIDRLRELEVAFGGRASTVYSSTLAIEEMLPRADLVIGAVLVHGGRAPHVVTREQLALMKRHAVLVDVSIDQGGCFETSRPTTHSDPTFEVDGITHYCVTNMPGAVPITSTYALTNATLPYVIALAEHGVDGALEHDPGLRLGLNVRDGEITHPAVAEALRLRGRADRDASGVESGESRHEPMKPRHGGGTDMATHAETLSNFIDGERVASDGETEAVLNPATGEELARAPISSAEDVDRAVRAARRAFDGWSHDDARRSARRRCWRWPTLIEEHGEEIARLEALNAGKPIEAVTERRDAGDGRQPALLRRRRALPGGAGGGRVHGGLHLVHAARGGRRDRPDHALELPADDGDLEDRAGARGRQHDRAEAGGDDADHDACGSPSWRPRSCRRACST